MSHVLARSPLKAIDFGKAEIVIWFNPLDDNTSTLRCIVCEAAQIEVRLWRMCYHRSGYVPYRHLGGMDI